jgi:cation diffusion facilitator CzcD-associated flavoprotein CzcO
MSTERPRIVVIGSGAGGMAFAIALKRQLNFQDFIIYEKGPDVGGTWRDNIYPACASDVGIHLYSLSSDLKHDWKRELGTQPEIQAYWKNLAKKYSLYQQTIFNSKVISAEWNSAEQRYHIVVEDLKTGQTTFTTAQILISATGVLEVPRLPPSSIMPGIQSFKGEHFHSARWDYSVCLRGKRVAVIGNGSSASQFVPRIAQDPSTFITNFWRTPAWFFPRTNTPYSPFEKWVFKYIPFAKRIHRAQVYFRLELNYLLFRSATVQSLMMKYLTKSMLAISPPEYHDKIIPNFPPGCKRIIIGKSYLESMNQPNVKINWDGIAEVVPEGILTKKGEKIPFDVIIYATGFVTDQYPLSIRGIDGRTIEDYYRSTGGPQAYLGITTPGFPNLYILGGPNTATGHNSFIFTEELQIGYSLQLIKPVLEGTVSSFEVTAEATDAYNKKLQKRFLSSVFVHCASWYRAGGDGKISAIFPFSTLTYRWWLLWPNWSHYKCIRAERWLKQRRQSRLKQTLVLLAFASSISWMWTHPENLAHLLMIVRRQLGQVPFSLVAARKAIGLAF